MINADGANPNKQIAALKAETVTGRFNVVTKYDADPTGVSDSTTKFNSAITAANAVGGGTVFVPRGTYLIDPEVSIAMKSNVTLYLDAGVTINAAASDQGTYYIIKIENCVNAKVIGNKSLLHGERTTHIGSSGESGMGVAVYGGSNIEICGLRIDNCWGDGIYLSSYGGIGGESKYVHVHDNLIYNCRRNGISVVECVDSIVENNYVSNTNGTAPQSGIDLEPNSGYNVRNITVRGNFFYDNLGHGVLLYGTNCKYNRVVDNTCERNGQSGVRFGDNVQYSYARGNKCNSNTEYGISLDTAGGIASAATNYNTLNENTCVSNTLGGIRLNTIDGEDCDYNEIINNIVQSNGGTAGIYAVKANNIIINNNRCISNTGEGINTESLTASIVLGNEILLNGINGIKCFGTTSSVISKNFVNGNQEHGIFLRTVSDDNVISDNICTVNGQKTDDTYSNIHIDLDSNYNNVQGNTCRHGGGAKQTKYGIRVQVSTCDGNFVTNNDLHLSGKTSNFADAGTGTVTTAGNRTT